MAGNAKYNLHLRYIYTYMLLYKYMCEIVLGTGLVGFFGYLGIGDWAQSPIPNPQSPIPNDYNGLLLFI